jgi:hypothetical protein
MGAVHIPSTGEILAMSWTYCQQERIRLRNEISFARGEETTGGPSSTERVAMLNSAIEIIGEQLHRLSNRDAA